jgi:hypothetical protein
MWRLMLVNAIWLAYYPLAVYLVVQNHLPTLCVFWLVAWITTFMTALWVYRKLHFFNSLIAVALMGFGAAANHVLRGSELSAR